MKKVARSLIKLEGLDGLFPLLLPPQRGQVEIVVRPQKDIDATPGRRVRVQDVIALAYENAQSRRLALVVRDIEVVVEFAAKRGEPGNGPVLARLVVLKLRQRSTGDQDQRGIVGLYAGQGGMLFVRYVQLGQPSTQLGSNIKW